MTKTNWRVVTSPSALRHGLFGQIALFIFEVLPKLYQNQIYPDWKITSLVYGFEPDFTVVPGIFDLSYETKATQTKDIDLMDLRLHFVSVLGNQWDALHNLWNEYFSIPLRTVERANAFGDLSHAIGLHYRGTDKNSDLDATNPVAYDDFLTLIDDFINNHEDIDTIFVASDEYSIKQAIKANYRDKRIIETGEVGAYASVERNTYEKGDQAVLDCLLLSRCKYLIKNQSALSGFAKVFNPKIEAYRIAASKLFTDIPYFPDAYIPSLRSDSPKCKAILKRLLSDDWTENKKAWQKFGKGFISMERRSLKWKVERARYQFSRMKLARSHTI
jgi:hypothetical protein